jgi:uncharacterized protein (TIGR02266 family)
VLFILAQTRSAASIHERSAWEDMLRRAWTLLVPVYGEVRMAEALAASPEAKPLLSRKVMTDAQRPTARPMARRHPRIEVELDVVVVSEPNFSPGYVENLSEGGLFVATRDPMPVGSRVTMIIGLPDGRDPIALEGEVRWLRASEGDAPSGMGIRFVSVPAEGEGRLRAFIAERAPTLYED